MEEQVDQVGKALEDSADSIKSQEAALARANAIEDRIKSFLGFAGATEVLKTSARRAMATIKELDATMTEMAVVTDLTVGDYWDQLPQYSKQASDLGVSINSAYRAATLYYQQGLKTNEVNAISVETLKMARIAGLDASTATDKMTAALRGFNMELNETSAQRVSDVYSELAAITAADTKEIANAMTKTASIASNAGMEFETTAAFLSQIIETTRESAETAGTAMKTVIARFQELKKDPAEIGEVDGEIVDANKIETALRSVGVSLRNANGQFRDLDDVFLELSSKWDTLDTNTQRYIATIAAGSRQQSRFIAMMSDFGRTQELVTAANNSAGASNRQFEKTMDSLESKLEKLKNAWDEFSMGILNSDLVKVGVDILTKFLEIVNKATSAFDGLGGSIVKIMTVISLFKLGQKLFDKFRAPMIKFFADIIKESLVTGEKATKAFVQGS
jgi:TP901 family phage tail tape measure protein